MSLGRGQRAGTGSPKRWARFRRLLAYYLECVQEDHRQEVRFPRTARRPDYSPLEIPREWSLLEGAEAERRPGPGAIELLSRNRLRGQTVQLFYGYPVLASWEPVEDGEDPKCFFLPLFMQPVDVTPRGQGLVLTLAPDWPRVNREALRRLVGSTEEQNEVLERIGLLEWSADLPTVRIADAVRRILELDLPLPRIEPLDPDALVPGRYTGAGETGLLNRAILFAGEPSRYTAGLERELKDLAHASEAQLDGTALAPFFAEGWQAPRSTARPRDLIEVRGLNEEQRRACQSALQAPMTVVTGPPGTGKSQVVINLLANSFLQASSAVFSSRNRKAVTVVEERLNAIVDSPILLRLGSQDGLAARLSQTLTQLLSAGANPVKLAPLHPMDEQYAKTVAKRDDLERRIEEIRVARNEVDHLDQEVDAWRRRLPASELKQLEALTQVPDVEPLEEAVRLLELHAPGEPKRGSRIFRALRRPFDFRRAARRLNFVARDLPFPGPQPSLPIDAAALGEWLAYATRARDGALAAGALARYRKSLDALLKLGSLDQLSYEWNEERHRIWNLGRELLEAYRSSLGAALTQDAQAHMGQLRAVAAQLMVEDPGSREASRLRKQIRDLLPNVTRFLPVWAVTNLSAPGALPFHGGMFDLAVIDEASQCDIPSAIPLLFRARRAVVIGEPQQLRHIATLTHARESQLAARHGLTEAADQPFTFVNNSLFDLAASRTASVVALLDHFRSHADIVGFSNAHWYGEDLRILTDYCDLKTPGDEPPGIRWTQVESRVFRPAGGGAIAPEEAARVVEDVCALLASDFKGTVGVVSPFRGQANRIREGLYQRLSSTAMERVDLIADTAHGFQGDERDVIVFSPCIAAPIPDGARRFLAKTANLFNVAVTRARAQLRVVGDLGACELSGIPHVEAFARHYRQLQQDAARALDDSVGPFERPLEEALHAAGVAVIPQYVFGRYRLDLAIVEGDLKIDIEVDGEHFHKEIDGARCKEDLTRDQYLIQRGWIVLRFWAVEVRDRLDACVRRVLKVRGAPRRRVILTAMKGEVVRPELEAQP